MANELDKTIEELEAEVIAELEEGAHDAPKKGATAAEPMKKKPSDGSRGEEDIGGSTSSKVSPPTGKDASKGTKEISGDAQQKGEGKPDKMQKAKEAGKNTQKSTLRSSLTLQHKPSRIFDHFLDSL